jgi:hypothetical protein
MNDVNLAETVDRQPYFWRFRLADLVQALLLISAGVSFFLSYDHRLIMVETGEAEILKNVTDIVGNQSKLSSHVDQMDKEGTAIGKVTQSRNREVMEALSAKVDALSGKVDYEVPRIERMDANLSWIAEAIRMEKQAPPPK